MRSSTPFFLTAPAPPWIYTLSLHDALPIYRHQHGDLRLARRDGGVHRVDRTEHRADRHNAGDGPGEDREDASQQLRLLRVELRLAVRVNRHAFVVLQRAPGVLERRRVLEAERDGLEHVAPEYGHELLVFAPDLRFERRAGGREVTRDGPVATREMHRLPEAGVRKARDQTLAEADLGTARGRPLAVDHAHVAAHDPGLVAHAAHHHVRHFRRIEDLAHRHEDIDLGGDEGPAIGSGRDVRRRGDHAGHVPLHPARQLGCSPPESPERISRKLPLTGPASTSRLCNRPFRTIQTTERPPSDRTASAGTMIRGRSTGCVAPGAAAAAGAAGSRNSTFAPISVRMRGSRSRIETLTWTVARWRSAVGLDWRTVPRNAVSG